MHGKIAEHHSLTDWDFRYGDTNRSLSADQYISEPTSLKILENTSTLFYEQILCRIPGTLCLPQGEVRSWLYAYYTASHPANFRNQSPLGSPDGLNCYQIYLTGTSAFLHRWVDGAYTVCDSTTCTTFSLQWTHYRIFWYNGKTPGEVPALCVDIYREIDSEWVKEGSTLYDTGNYFKDSEINRCGFTARSRYGWPQYHDDTEIWGPV